MKKIITIIFIGITFPLAAQWTHRFNGEGDFSDKINALTTDAAGNIYAAGYTMQPEQSKDLLLIRLNTSGDTIWTRTFNGPGNGPDEATAMITDAAGNIYCTGYEKGAGTGYDIVTIKYSADGNIVWTNTYNYTANEFDQGNSIAVDAAGNIYVAGQSDKDATLVNNDDFLILKYTAAGTQSWVKRSNGAGNSTDRPAKILIGPDGNPIVTGRTDNGSDDDFMTVKYDAATGSELWRNYFDRTHHDRPTGMVINASTGNIFITGRSNNGTNYDFATVCYDAAGNQVWQSIFDYVDDDRATGIALDAAGNVFVTGQSDIDASIGTNYDILTVKYNAAGFQQFAQSYGDAANNDDIPTGIVTDNSGNIFITGYSDKDAAATIENDFIALKYSGSGVLSWSQNYSAGSNYDDIATSAIKLNDGSICMAGYSAIAPDKNCTIVTISTEGSINWSASYNGAGDNSDNAHALLRDAANNIYIAGYTFGYESDRNFMVMKLNASGNLVWEKEINGSSLTQSWDDATAIATDNAGNIYAAGYEKNSGTGYDLLLAKFSTAGDTVWTRTYNNPLSNETDKAVDLALDAAGNIYVTGRSDQDASIVSNDDIITIKYAPSGTVLWMNTYNGTGNGSDMAKVIRIGNSGNIYVAGKSFNGTDNDMVLIKYDADGVQEWLKKYDAHFGDDEVTGIQLDADENIYVTGFITNSNRDKDAAALKYSAAGVLLNDISFDGPEHGDDIGKSIRIDSEGNYVIGATVAPDTAAATLNGDIAILKYSNNGDLLWSQSYDGGANDDASEISITASDAIIITGQTDNGTAELPNYDYVTITYLPDGTQSDIQFYNGTGNSADVANTLLTESNGFYISGGSNGEGNQRDITTILYGTTPDAIHEWVSENNAVLFPNPVAGAAVITLPDGFTAGDATLRCAIYNSMGSAVRNFIIPSTDTISFQRENLPAGMYVFSVIRQDSTEIHIAFEIL